ncbi:MAG: hypothetical protein KAR85_04230 [Methanosarcinales archaeon]|nr:hypothetical protein [Methanosarcinales archaeon]
MTCAMFRGTNKTYILDRKDFSGDLYAIYEEVVVYLQSRLNTALIPHARGRDERLELPVDALREAVVNAIAHRDYRSTANVQLYIFHDRLEIVTPGGLPAGMREEDLGVKSVPRNPLLFGMFYRMGMVEQVGSGIKRIREMCRDYGVAEPMIEVSENWVTTTFKRPNGQVEDQNKGEVTPKVTPQVISEVLGEDTGEVEPQPESQPESLEMRVLTLLINAPMAKSALSTELGQKEISGQLNSVIRLLLANKTIEYTIPEKPNSRLQKYRLTAKSKEHLKRGEKSQ